MTEKLQAALDALYACKTADEVADLLRRNGIKGSRTSYFSCPVAEFLKKLTGTDAVFVGPKTILADEEEGATPPAATEFMTELWDFAYPDLIAA